MYSICMHNCFMIVCQLYCQMYTNETNDVESERFKLLVAFLNKKCYCSSMNIQCPKFPNPWHLCMFVDNPDALPRMSRQYFKLYKQFCTCLFDSVGNFAGTVQNMRLYTYKMVYPNGEVRTLKKFRTSKGDYKIKQWFSSIASLFKMETSLKERIRSLWEQILSFKSRSLWNGKSLLPH